MIRINSVDSLSCKKPNFCSNPVTVTNQKDLPQVEHLPDCTNDVGVKVPMKYQKIGILNLPYGLKAHCYKLANGQQVIIADKKGVTEVKTYVNTGSMNEPDNVRGISHYIEHNLFNGSDGLASGEFFKTVNDMGAETNASTGFTQTSYYISSNLLNENDLEKKIKIHASMIQSPKFAVEMLEKEKGIVNSEINMYQDFAENKAVNLTLKSLFNIKSESQDLIAGTTKNINNITREDVVDYYNNNYYPANMVTVITGEVNPDKTMDLVAKYFNSTNKGTHQRKFEKLDSITKTQRQDINSDTTNSTHVVLGFVGPKNNDCKSAVCMQIINGILTNYATGRFDKALKQYNTTANLNIERIGSLPQDNSVIIVTTKTNEQDCENVLKELFNQIYSITTNPDFDKELYSTKKAILNARALRYESSAGINSLIGESVLDGNVESIINYENLVNSITKEDIINTAKQYLDLNKTAVTVVHPNKSKNEVVFTGAKQAVNPDDVQRYRMNNNFEVVINNSTTDIGAISISYNSKNIKNFNPATEYVLNNILESGSMYRNEVEYNDLLQQDAISTIFSADSRNLSAFSKFNNQDVIKSLKSTLEVLYNPRFTQETFEQAKSKIKHDFVLKEKSALDKLNKEIYNGLDRGHTKEEILDGLDKLTLNDVVALYQHIMANSQACVTVTAPFDKNPQLKEILFNELAYLPTVKQCSPQKLDIYRPITQTKVLVDTNQKNQADIIEAFKFQLDGNLKDILTIDLMNTILGGNSSSRLFNDLREKQQLAYHVGSRVSYDENFGLIKLSIGTTTENKNTNEVNFDNVQKSIDGFNKHINKMCNEKVTQEELQNAKLNLKNRILSNYEISLSRNAMMADNMAGYYGELQDNMALEIIDKITAEDIYNAANYVFANKPIYSILATENTINANKEYLKKLSID